MVNQIFFYGLAAFILFSAYFVVTPRNLFRSAMGLIAVLLGVADLFLLMDAQFMSALQMTVYVGGIVVLILFVILLVADVTQKVFYKAAAWRKGVVGLFSVLLFLFVTYALRHPGLTPNPGISPDSATTVQIGRALLAPTHGGYVLPFEVISLVLIAALIGAVTVAAAGHTSKNGKDS